MCVREREREREREKTIFVLNIGNIFTSIKDFSDILLRIAMCLRVHMKPERSMDGYLGADEKVILVLWMTKV